MIVFFSEVTEVEIQRILDADNKLVPEFWRNKYINEARRMWDVFYKLNGDRFARTFLNSHEYLILAAEQIFQRSSLPRQRMGRITGRITSEKGARSGMWSRKYHTSLARSQS